MVLILFFQQLPQLAEVGEEQDLVQQIVIMQNLEIVVVQEVGRQWVMAVHSNQEVLERLDRGTLAVLD
jgi:hypothetical protein